MKITKAEPFMFAADARVRVALFLVICAIAILNGQVGRELLAPDDLREVEIAREMYVSGDYVIPHLAGLPFVEKPPGFPAIVALAYWIAGGPSADAARITGILFAFASLTSVFLLGKHILGIESGAIAAAILAFSMRFCITAHEVLLDNALTAAVAFTILFTWRALEEEISHKKRLFYTAAGLSLGISFLFKGFVGPTIFGSGYFVYLSISKRFEELRYIIQPLPVIAFLAPILVWLVPFILRAPHSLLKEFFIANHFGRFFSAYESNKRPLYFYILNIWMQFAPGSLLLPLAVYGAFKTRKNKENQAGIFLLSLFIGPLVVLSISLAKDHVYFMPVFPALAVLVVWGSMQGLLSVEKGMKNYIMGISIVVVLATGGMVAFTSIHKGPTFSNGIILIIFIITAAGCMFTIFQNALRRSGLYIAVLCTLCWNLWFTGPISAANIKKNCYHKPMLETLRLVGNRDILLYHPSDGIRGAAGFYRNKTAREVLSPNDLISQLTENPDNTVALCFQGGQEDGITTKIYDTARNVGANLHIEACVKFGKNTIMVVSAEPKVLKNDVDLIKKQ